MKLDLQKIRKIYLFKKLNLKRPFSSTFSSRQLISYEPESSEWNQNLRENLEISLKIIPNFITEKACLPFRDVRESTSSACNKRTGRLRRVLYGTLQQYIEKRGVVCSTIYNSTVVQTFQRRRRPHHHLHVSVLIAESIKQEKAIILLHRIVQDMHIIKCILHVATCNCCLHYSHFFSHISCK